MNRIRLSKSTTGWLATYTGPHASEIQELFGSNVLPTAYTARADAETVLANVARLNPGVEVSIELLARKEWRAVKSSVHKLRVESKKIEREGIDYGY